MFSPELPFLVIFEVDDSCVTERGFGTGGKGNMLINSSYGFRFVENFVSYNPLSHGFVPVKKTKNFHYMLKSQQVSKLQK